MIKTAQTKHQVHELIKSRWSPRAFSDTDISEEELMTLFEAAQWAASSMNEQPWRFIYFRKGTEAYQRIFECLAEFNQKWVRNAPVLVITIYKKYFDSGKENFHALHDLGLAVGNMSIQAESMGIALHQMAGVKWKEVHAELDIDQEKFHVTTAIAIGRYGGDPETLPEDLEESERKERKRKPLDQVVYKGAWRHD